MGRGEVDDSAVKYRFQTTSVGQNHLQKGKPMSIQKLADNLYIAPQLTEADVQEAAKLGIQTVICNRP